MPERSSGLGWNPKDVRGLQHGSGKGEARQTPPPPPQGPSDSTCSHEPHHHSLSEEQRVGNSRLHVHGPNNFTGRIPRPILGPQPPPPPELTWWPSRAIITSAEDRGIQEEEPERISIYKQLPAEEEGGRGQVGRQDSSGLQAAIAKTGSFCRNILSPPWTEQCLGFLRKSN